MFISDVTLLLEYCHGYNSIILRPVPNGYSGPVVFLLMVYFGVE